MAEIQRRKVKLAGLNMFCHYTHGVADTSLVSRDACPDSFSPVRPSADETRSVGFRPTLPVGRSSRMVTR
jgi:hypothetical protein